jgi:hypothetical protein
MYGEERNTQFSYEPEEKKPVARPMHKWDNIKTDL